MILNGEFRVRCHKNKYKIYYSENGKETLCPMAEFDNYNDAVDYINSHRGKLENYMNEIKKVQKDDEKKKEVKKAEKEKKKKAKKAKKEKNKGNRRTKVLSWIAGFMVAVFVLVGGHWLFAGVAYLLGIHKNNDNDALTNGEGTTIETPLDQLPTRPSYIEDIIKKDENLSEENFANLVANFAKPYTVNNLNVTTEDLTKFVSIVNIDKLVEENPEFAKELFSTQTKEEFLNDAAKVIGMTYTYNRNVFEKEGSTENFIRISESVSGKQKEKVKVIEDYVDQIALARNNSEDANRLISELIIKLGDPQSELSYLDDGVGFGIQVYVELIRSYLAKDVISKENFDMLTVLTSSEEYVSNIFTTYNGCLNSYTKTR